MGEIGESSRPMSFMERMRDGGETARCLVASNMMAHSNLLEDYVKGMALELL
jgi:hypothetical protein